MAALSLSRAERAESERSRRISNDSQLEHERVEVVHAIKGGLDAFRYIGGRWLRTQTEDPL